RAHRWIIENAAKDDTLDEVVVVVSVGHVSKENFASTLAQRLFMLKEELKDLPKVSIVITQTPRFAGMAKVLRKYHRKTDYRFIMGFDNFEQMMTGNPKPVIEEFFTYSRISVVPRGYASKKDITRVLIENDLPEYISRYVDTFILPRENRFDSSTEVRRRIRENTPENTLITPRALRIIKGLGLYKAKPRKDEVKVITREPVKIVMVNFTSPRHQVITEPAGINALMGDLRRKYGEDVIISMVDTQFGMKAVELMDEVRKQSPDILGLSAQLESDKLLYEFLDILKDQDEYKTRKMMTVMGSNLPTNENRSILLKYPNLVTVRGEGEMALRELVRFQRGEISPYDVPAASFVIDGKIVENDGVPVSVADLGLPSRDELQEILRRGGDIWMETSRGCGWGKCAFCFKDPYRAHKWEPFPDEVIFEGLKYLQENGAKHVSFTDPEFFGGGKETLNGLRRARRIAEGMIERGIKLRIAVSLRADTVFAKNDSEELRQEKRETFELLKRAGFESLFLGIESGSDRQLRHYVKGIKVEENEGAIRVLRGLGFNVCIGFIPLDPLANLEDLRENVRFIRKNDLYLEVSFPLNQLKVQANTDYYNITLSKGLLGRRRNTVHTFECGYEDSAVGRIADIINTYAREIGSVFYVIKYMYRTAMLNDRPDEAGEKDELKRFFIGYNKMEIDFLDALVGSVDDAETLYKTINEFRARRLDLVLEVERSIKQGLIGDENSVLAGEVSKIRDLLDAYTSRKLRDVSEYDIVSLAREESDPMKKIRGILAKGYPGVVDTAKTLAVYGEMIKDRGDLAEIDNLPVQPIERNLELYVHMSDDLETVTLYKVTGDDGVYTPGLAPDYSRLRKELIASFPSFHLMFPDNYVAKHFSGITLSRILTLFARGGKYTEYRGVVTNNDARVDLDTWSTNIDTVFLHKTLEEKGILNRGDIKTVMEVGVGGGHVSAACAAKLPGLKELIMTDVSLYSLMAAKRNTAPLCESLGVKVRTFLGKGVSKIEAKADLIVLNPPYLPTPPWENGPAGALDDPFKGTGLMREMVRDGMSKLNPDNPDAGIIMNYSELAQEDMDNYLRAYGQMVDVEVLSEGFKVPLKIERMDARWMDWLAERGLIVDDKAPKDGFKYWHSLKVVRIRPKKLTVIGKGGDERTVTAGDLAPDMLRGLNDISFSGKIKILALKEIDLSQCEGLDGEWLEARELVSYYKESVPAFRKAVEGHLKTRVDISARELLAELFDMDKGFFSRNVIRSIYFNSNNSSGNNPHVPMEVINKHRDFINEAPERVKKIILKVFEENIGLLGWDNGIELYLAGKGLRLKEDGPRISDITDTSIGTGVYKAVFRVNDNSGNDAGTVELFLKRQHKGHGDLRNDVAFSRFQAAMVPVSMPGSESLYYPNPDDKYPGILITPVIGERSLDLSLKELMAVSGYDAAREKEPSLTEEPELTEAGIRSAHQVYRAFSDIQDARLPGEERLEALRVLKDNERFIIRSERLKGKADLHAHTIYSDGDNTPESLVFKAWLNGMNAIAITDHISLGGIPEAMDAAAILGDIEVIPGIEFYTGDKKENLINLHVIVYFPLVKTADDVKPFMEKIGKNGDYREMLKVAGNREANVRAVVKKFNEIHKEHGFVLTEEDILSVPQKMMTFWTLSGILLKKYGETALGAATQEEIKVQYIDEARDHIVPGGRSSMDIEEILTLSARMGGVTSLPHPLRHAKVVPTRVRKIRSLFERYATVEVDGLRRPGFQAIGMFGSGMSEEDIDELRGMLIQLDRSNPFYGTFPVVRLNESDYHGQSGRDLLFGARDKNGFLSVPPETASRSRADMLRERASTLEKIGDVTGADLIAYGKHILGEERLMRDIIDNLAYVAAFGDLVGRNDRKYSNTRISVRNGLVLKDMTGFDVAEFLDEDNTRPDGWFLNYDWAREDVKQGIGEITLLSLLDDYREGEGPTYKERLRARIELFKDWKEKYLQKWEELTRPGAVRMMKDTLTEVYADTPGLAEEKITVLDKRLKFGALRYLKQIFAAHLRDYETRRLYLGYLDKVREKAGRENLGYLDKFASHGSDRFLSSKIEAMRGVLTRDFIERRGLKDRKPEDVVLGEIEKMVQKYLGKASFGAMKKEAARIRRNAKVVLEECFRNGKGHSGDDRTPVGVSDGASTGASGEYVVKASGRTVGAAMTATKDALRTDFLRDIRKENELMKTMGDLLLSRAVSGRKLVLVFDTEIGSNQEAAPLTIMRRLKSLKKDEVYAKLLDNIEIIEKNAAGIHNRIQGYFSEDNADILIFADLKNKETLRGVEKNGKANMYYLDLSRLESGDYCPLAEVVTLALAEHLFGLDGVYENLRQLGITLNDLMVEEIEKIGTNLVFKLLPGAEKYSKQELIKRYSRLKEYLVAA
ncbi:MAG: radical SAM protein, partial [Candidatus Omnitrophica bacterium]|nr:radical SAM protein [Candidatus Omnitrophota bacterium]